MRKLAGLMLSLFIMSVPAFADTPKDADAQPAPAGAPAKPAKAKAAPAAKKAEGANAAFAAELEELRQALQSQQEQLQLLKEELAKRDRQIDEAREAAAAANTRAAEATAKATEVTNSAAELKTTTASLSSSVSDLKVNTEAVKTSVATVAKAQEAAKKAEEAGPVSIRFKGITITPGGFLAAESVWRQRSMQSDVNSPFTSAPFPNNDLSRASEFNASGRQSRLSFLFEGKADQVKLTGYYELDWLGACASSNSRQSNSYCMRQRQIWGQAEFNGGWMITGGQMWSLATERRKGPDNRTETPPLTIDAAYNVGFTWARQWAVRVTKNFNNKAWFAVAAENPQTTLGARGQPTAFFVGAPGSAGGTFNPVDGTGYSSNPIPDFIIKAAFEPGFGHYEVFGIVSNFRQRVYPCSAPVASIPLPAGCPAVGAANAFNNTVTGGGVGVNIRVPVTKQVDFGVHVLGGDGVGRYSAAQLADVTARPNGTLSLIRGGGGLLTLEVHPSPKLDLYLNYGAEYAYRTAYDFTTPAGTVTGAGFGSTRFNNSGCELADSTPTAPFVTTSNGTCNGDIKTIQEGTFGFWHKLYQGPKGGLRWGIQYSYLWRVGWPATGGLPAGSPAVSPKSVDNMVFSSFRYYIP